MGIGATELLLIFVLVPFFLVLPLIALVDILRSKFEGNDNIMFVLIVILLPIIGSILYFILGRARKIKRG